MLPLEEQNSEISKARDLIVNEQLKANENF
jgi:hypothetical protein